MLKWLGILDQCLISTLFPNKKKRLAIELKIPESSNSSNDKIKYDCKPNLINDRTKNLFISWSS